MSGHDREIVIYHLASVGSQGFTPSMSEPVITAAFSQHIQQVLGCTMFSLLNRLEKLDGAYNTVRFPKATLKLQVPAGGKKGLMKCEMLIMQLYPWLSVSESTSNVIAAAPAAPQQPPKAARPAADKEPAKEKEGFFKKLFHRQ